MKDYFCLPRPLSPPVLRLSLSRTISLEYGFPSTHTWNAISTGLLMIALALSSRDTQTKSAESTPPAIFAMLQKVIDRALGSKFLAASSLSTTIAFAAFYMTVVTFGRIYCGMHGFIDIGVGALLGAAAFAVRWLFHPAFCWMYALPTIWSPIALSFIVLATIFFRPVPLGDCPCYKDSICFGSVLIGAYFSYYLRGDTLIAAQGVPVRPLNAIARYIVGKFFQTD